MSALSGRSGDSSDKKKSRSLLFNPLHHTVLEPPCERCSNSNYECFKTIMPSAFEKKFKCMKCREDRRVCSLSPDDNLSTGTLNTSKVSSKRKASSSPEPEFQPQSSKPKSFTSSTSKPSTSSKPKPSASSGPSRRSPTSLPVTDTTFSARLDIEDVRGQVRVLSQRVTEVEEARVRERAAYGQSLQELSSRLDNLERSEKRSRD